MREEQPRTILSTTGITPEEVLRRTFDSTRRGFDPAAVRTFLDQVARELSAQAAREQELREELARAVELAANPTFDQGTLAAAVGQETAKVLRSAHDAAAELLTRGRDEASTLRESTEREIAQLRSETETYVTDLRRDVEAQAAEVSEAAKLEAESLLEQTRSECRVIVQDANELRNRVLEDLKRKRRGLHAQIEQLRAGREHLAETITAVGRSVEAISSDLFRAEDEARLAAEAVGRQVVSNDADVPADTGDLTDPVAPAAIANPLDTGMPPLGVSVLSSDSGVPVSSGTDDRVVVAVGGDAAELKVVLDPIADLPPDGPVSGAPATPRMPSVRPLSNSTVRPRIAARFDDEAGTDPEVDPEVVIRPAVRSGVVVAAPTAAQEAARSRVAVESELSAPVAAADSVSLPADEATGDVSDDDAAVDVSDAVSQQKAHELFARLRADTQSSDDSSSAKVLAKDGPKEPVKEGPKENPNESVSIGEGASAAASLASVVKGEASSQRVGETDTSKVESTESVDVLDEVGDQGDGTTEIAGQIAVDPLLARRDQAIAPVVSALARRLKRTLQDDQNDILDRVRSKGGWSTSVLLPAEEHEQRYAAAALEQLGEAARAGAVFVGANTLNATGELAVAAELAAAVAGPLRRRILDAAETIEADDEAAFVEYVGATFREWKGDRVGRLAEDFVVEAFAISAMAASAADSVNRWVVDDKGEDCPDCDDNALAGPTARGEAFPTGHVHPPAHAGCRCLLAPVTA